MAYEEIEALEARRILTLDLDKAPDNGEQGGGGAGKGAIVAVVRHFGLLAALVAVFVIAGLAACGGSDEGGELEVVASIFPLADFARNVGQDRVEVVTLLPTGADPHSYEPKPRQVRDIAEAGVFIKNGADLELWAEKLVSAADHDVVELDTSEGIELIRDDGEGNPHIWLDPVLAQKQVRDIRDALIRLDPQNGEFYRENARRYVAALDLLAAKIRQEVNNFSTKKFIAFHPAWSYFAQSFGLTEIAVIESRHSIEPLAPAHLATVIETGKGEGVRVIFAHLGATPRAEQTVNDIAAEIDAEVVYLDPVGGPDLEDRDTYLKLMRYNLEQLSQAME
jgi:zinc transport system substrate-binding protein